MSQTYKIVNGSVVQGSIMTDNLIERVASNKSLKKLSRQKAKKDVALVGFASLIVISILPCLLIPYYAGLTTPWILFSSFLAMVVALVGLGYLHHMLYGGQMNLRLGGFATENELELKDCARDILSYVVGEDAVPTKTVVGVNGSTPNTLDIIVISVHYKQDSKDGLMLIDLGFDDPETASNLVVKSYRFTSLD